MSSKDEPSSRSRVRRMPELARYDDASVHEVFDAAPFCHVAGVVDGRAVSLPTLHVRRGQHLYLHGSRSNALLRAIRLSGEASVSAALYDGLRLARSGFESSVAYRSVVAFGTVVELVDAERDEILDLFLNRFLPGRSSEVRALSDQERALTLVVDFEISEASVKLSSGPTDDSELDASHAIWSGVIPAYLTYGAPLGSFDGAMAHGDVAVPASLGALSQRTPKDLVDDIRQQIVAITPVDLREASSIAALEDRLSWPIDLFDQRLDPRHLTASAFVVSQRGVILHRHRILGIWIQPGGHVDPGESVAEAAVREVLEETGLRTTVLDDGRIFHVDVHPGPRGHTHYDLRVLLWSDGSDPSPPPDESPEVAWFSFAEAPERAETAMRPALDKLARVVHAKQRATLER